MSAAFVLGNGISRLSVDLSVLKQRGTVYGCNALYREFVPNVLISTDKAIAHTIQHSGYAQEHAMYTRKPLPGLGARSVPQNYFGFSSGPIAVGLAAIDKHLAVYLLGFDMGPTLSNRFNNVYANTEFYKKSSSNPTFTGNWIRQIVTVTRDFPNTSFHRVMGDTTADIAELRGIKNMRHMPMADFLDRINNIKDL
mgnify:CR=1 FL=1|jgi:hypothetical protein